MYYVYCLKSVKDNKYYIGQTENITDRVKNHNSGRVRSTRLRVPFVLVGFEEYEARNQAMWRERELKKSSHKRKRFFQKMEKSFQTPL